MKILSVVFCTLLAACIFSTAGCRASHENTSIPAPTLSPAAPLPANAPTSDTLKTSDALTTSTDVSIAEPLYYWNVAWFHFDDKFYFWLLKPISVGYRYIIYPEAPRRGIHNFFENIGFPGRFINCGLQARFKGSGIELVRFLSNTTLGVAGLWDPAKDWFHLEPQKAMFDQTFGKWGIGQGFYLVMPLMGPSSLRGLFAMAGDAASNPATYLNVGPVGLVVGINEMSLGHTPYESAVKMPPDPYTAVRNGYVKMCNESLTAQ